MPRFYKKRVGCGPLDFRTLFQRIFRGRIVKDIRTHLFLTFPRNIFYTLYLYWIIHIHWIHWILRKYYFVLLVIYCL